MFKKLLAFTLCLILIFAVCGCKENEIVISDDTEIGIKVNSRSHNYLIAIDGRNESCDDCIDITVRKADYKQLIIRRREHTFIQNLQEKLMWGADVRD